MSTTSIEWTEITWNPTSGCSKISEGCKNCYAERMANRLKSMGMDKYRNGFDFTIHPEVLKDPYGWKTPKTVFVNSMSDLFHEEIKINFIQQVFKTMAENPQHTFQILTKRADLLVEYSSYLPWSNNIWMGVTVESDKYINRINQLKKTEAYVKFISMEPLLSPMQRIDLSNIDWVIVGGESGPGARMMHEKWVVNIKKNCEEQDVAFFFKQWGGINKKKTGRMLDGQTWDQMPIIEELEMQ